VFLKRAALAALFYGSDSLLNGQTEAKLEVPGPPFGTDFGRSGVRARREIMAERLTALGAFEILRPEQVHILSDSAEKVRFDAGDTVYSKGGKADHFYVILEGQVSLRLPGKGGVSIVIDQLAKGALFGSCVCMSRDSYALTAQCTEYSELLKIESKVLKALMDEDPLMGYGIQSWISGIYFTRYIETMKKLQAIVMNIPMESD
jgi:CRP-like cAMP-binding protein